jgi:hypothetical protein
MEVSILLQAWGGGSGLTIDTPYCFTGATVINLEQSNIKYLVTSHIPMQLITI